jgi:uncharacterized protein (DUF1800 family)
MTISSAAAIAANRFGLGARPGELAGMGDARGWLSAQLRSAPPAPGNAGLKSSLEVMQGAADLALKVQETAGIGTEQPPTESNSSDSAAIRQQRQQQVANRLPRYFAPIYQADAVARLQNAVTTASPFAERLVQFWSNHFAVSVDKVPVLALAGCMEREAIRPNILGNFRDLLLSVEKHPAMLMFLDNQLSMGPASPLAARGGQRRRQLGLNENLAREILELHTVGVDGGYTQADVTSFAKVITGWSVGGLRNLPGRLQDTVAPGSFTFRPMIHEPGPQTVFGRRYAQDGLAQGEAVLRDLAASPKTARHLATKLARHFIADDPPPSAVDRLTRAYLNSGGHLPAVYQALIDAPEAWSQDSAKFKTPNDYVVSVYRGLELPLPDGQRAPGTLTMLGQQQFRPGSPAGWPDRSADWDGSAALLKRIELADTLAQSVSATRDANALAPQLLGATLSEATRTAIARADSPAQALTLLLTAPEFMRR